MPLKEKYIELPVKCIHCLGLIEIEANSVVGLTKSKYWGQICFDEHAVLLPLISSLSVMKKSGFN